MCFCNFSYRGKVENVSQGAGQDAPDKTAPRIFGVKLYAQGAGMESPNLLAPSKFIGKTTEKEQKRSLSPWKPPSAGQY